MAKEPKTAETPEKVEPVVFSKSSILRSKAFSNRRDALSFLLKDGELYTLKQVEDILDKFMKGQVK